MKKVKCKVCANTDDNICKVKGVKVGQNKPRLCTSFIYDALKVKVKTKLKSSYLPLHMRSAKAYKEYAKEQELAEYKQAKLDTLKSPDCLNQFRSSATDA